MRLCVGVIKTLIDVGGEVVEAFVHGFEAFVDIGSELFKPFIDVGGEVIKAFVHGFKAFVHCFETNIHRALQPINL